MTSQKRLSKTAFMRGMQCEKALWLHYHKPEVQDETPPDLRARFDRGIEVGVLAHGLFPGGLDLSPEYVDGVPKFDKPIQDTKAAIKNSVAVLYEPAFSEGGGFAAVDILVRDKRAWKAYEVKSSTRVRDPHVMDAALQYWVLERSWLEVSDFSIVHLDKACGRPGETDPARLFCIASVLDRIKPMQEEVGRNVARLLAVLDLAGPPPRSVGPHCSEPYACPFTGWCRGA